MVMGVFKKLSNRRNWTLGHDHVLQLDKLKEWQLCNKPPDCMPPARNKLKGKTNTIVTSEPSPITSDLSNYQYLQKQLFHFWTVNPPDFFFFYELNLNFEEVMSDKVSFENIVFTRCAIIAAIKCTQCLLHMIYDRNGCMSLIKMFSIILIGFLNFRIRKHKIMLSYCAYIGTTSIKIFLKGHSLLVWFMCIYNQLSIYIGVLKPGNFNFFSRINKN